MNWNKIKDKLKGNRIANRLYKKTYKLVQDAAFSPVIPEIQEIIPRPLTELGDTFRINIIVPSINKEHVFGGISTALKFYKEMEQGVKGSARIIVTDSLIDRAELVKFEGYSYVQAYEDCIFDKQIVGISDRFGKSLPVAKNDIFVATAWWTAYNILPIIKWQSETYQSPLNKLVYFIQDYEPGFYPWSTRYLMADSTYKSSVETIAIFNSKQLQEYFQANNYRFYREFFFEPTLESSLKEELTRVSGRRKIKQLLIYGRPSTQRNGFELIVASLKEWCKYQEDIAEWRIVSAGESHPEVILGNGATLHSLGKLSLREYAELMADTYMGVSLMISPHPSYPPLEMAKFGVKVITNGYANKNLSTFNKNITSLDNCCPELVAKTLLELGNIFTECWEIDLDDQYVRGTDRLKEISQELARYLGG